MPSNVRNNFFAVSSTISAKRSMWMRLKSFTGGVSAATSVCTELNRRLLLLLLLQLSQSSRYNITRARRTGPFSCQWIRRIVSAWHHDYDRKTLVSLINRLISIISERCRLYPGTSGRWRWRRAQVGSNYSRCGVSTLSAGEWLDVGSSSSSLSNSTHRITEFAALHCSHRLRSLSSSQVWRYFVSSRNALTVLLRTWCHTNVIFQ